MLAMASYRCEYCHKSLMSDSFEIEHIKPKAYGGDNDPLNIAIACGRCNRNKEIRSHFIDPLTRKLSPIFVCFSRMNKKFINQKIYFRV